MKIGSRADYQYYLKQDRIALGIDSTCRSKLKRFFIKNEIWSFQKTLRKAEYYKNCKNDIFSKVLYGLIKIRLHKKSVKLGFSIPENVFGPGLAIVHYGTIVVNASAKVGANCRIHACTNIGASGGEANAPTLGNNVYIAPGVKIYGNISIAENIAFAANAAVNRDCLESNSTYGGVPAKRLGSIDISRVIPQLRKA